MTAAAIAGAVVIGFGAVFLFLGALGILRLPDVYNRLQAGTKCTTLGAFCAIVGVGIAQPEWIFKALIVAVFILLTNPISAHALARASYKSAVRPYDGTVVDKCREFGECKEAGGAGSGPEPTVGEEE
jgi:multicomponent Na+:H+ antiporter subunit G